MDVEVEAWRKRRSGKVVNFIVRPLGGEERSACFVILLISAYMGLETKLTMVLVQRKEFCGCR